MSGNSGETMASTQRAEELRMECLRLACDVAKDDAVRLAEKFYAFVTGQAGLGASSGD